MDTDLWLLDFLDIDMDCGAHAMDKKDESYTSKSSHKRDRSNVLSGALHLPSPLRSLYGGTLHML